MLLLILFQWIHQTAHSTEKLVINEIMYNSPGTDVEFIELYNASDTEVNLTGWYILDNNDSHTPCTLEGTLAPDDYFVVVGDRTLFGAKYPGVDNVNPHVYDPNGTGWAFGNGGDSVRLFNGTGTLHDIVEYDDGSDWPGRADGNGPSLELLHPSLDNGLPTSWEPSVADWGTPGRQNSVYPENVVPTCKDGQRHIDLPGSSDDVLVSVLAFDIESLAKVDLYVNTGSGFVPQSMNDNGQDGDVTAGDSLFSSVIPAQASGALVKYYAVATDDIGQTDSWPNDAPDAPFSYHAYTVDYMPPNLRITEVLPKNDTGLKDEAGERDDWFEIYNPNDVAVNLGGMFVSDDLGVGRNFELPSVDLNPGEYMIIWADDDVGQGPLHTDFKLAAGGEAVALFETVDHGNVLIDGWQFGLMSSDVSMGFLPIDGTAPEYLSLPTPGASNESSMLFSPVCINEFLATSAFGGVDDWVEIYNRSDAPFELSSCFLSDGRGDLFKWTFPPGTILEPGKYLVIYEDALGFGFSSAGDDVIMFTAADSVTGLDFYDFGAQQPDITHGRYPDGTGYWEFFRTATPSETNVSQTGVDTDLLSVPEAFQLYPNYPNPFNPETTIEFNLPGSQRTVVKIYDALGREIVTLLNRELLPGKHRVSWTGEDAAGSRVSSGIYIYRVEAGEFQATGKMVLMQ